MTLRLHPGRRQAQLAGRSVHCAGWRPFQATGSLLPGQSVSPHHFHYVEVLFMKLHGQTNGRYGIHSGLRVATTRMAMVITRHGNTTTLCPRVVHDTVIPNALSTTRQCHDASSMTHIPRRLVHDLAIPRRFVRRRPLLRRDNQVSVLKSVFFGWPAPFSSLSMSCAASCPRMMEPSTVRRACCWLTMEYPERKVDVGSCHCYQGRLFEGRNQMALPGKEDTCKWHWQEGDIRQQTVCRSSARRFPAKMPPDG